MASTTGRTARPRCAVAALLVLAVLTPSSGAAAHRLDEYLQAARVSISKGRVDLELDLTPGAAIADRIVAGIDRNGNERFEDDEARAYAARVLEDVTLDVDGRRRQPTLVAVRQPPVEALREGVGTIRLLLRADFDPAGERHVLRFTNRHESPIGAYLANALTPAERSIAIGRQIRDARQQEIQIEFDVERRAGMGWLLAGPLAIAAVLAWRRARAVRPS